MKMKQTLTLLFLLIAAAVNAQFVATMEIKEPIEGICDDKKVYALFSMFNNQKQALCPKSKPEILALLNSNIQFVKDNPKYPVTGMIGLIINCKGEVVQCKMDNKTKSEELDRQIEAVFSSLGEWKPGKLNGKKVDSSRLFSFTIKKGVFEFE